MKEARERAPAKIIQSDMILRLAEKQLEAEQSLTDADIELIAGVWASKTMQSDELILEQYVGHRVDHIGHEKNAPKTGSSTRNGYSSKILLCDDGEIEISTPRDRESTFEP